jgi:hypothetical protein
LSQIEKLIPDNQVICQSGKPHAFIRVAHAFLEGIAVVHSLFWRFVGGEHVHPLRSRERGCFLVKDINPRNSCVIKDSGPIAGPEQLTRRTNTYCLTTGSRRNGRTGGNGLALSLALRACDSVDTGKPLANIEYTGSKY